ncbi:nuclear transport factor 2 family protein [bacterium]|nr:nuclear transport factor 2 family protein [bacterium]
MDDHSAKQKAWETVQQLNRTWTIKGDIEQLKHFFHDDMVAFTPMNNERLEGKEACFQGWKGFHDTCEIVSWIEREPLVQLYGNGTFAVVTYYYDIVFEMNGKKFQESGRDMFSLVKENGNWLAVADQFSSIV